MCSKRIAAVILLISFFVSAAIADVSKPLVSLDSGKLNEGMLETWENAGSLNGTFRNDDTNPQVKFVDDIKAVVFSGKDHMTADFTAPSSITGSQGWTCVVRAYSTQVSGERTIFSWANRPLNCLQIEYGDARLYGAIGTWNDPHTLGWAGNIPKSGQWHTLVYSYSGGQNGEMQAWCDGELRSTKKGTLATKPGKPFVIGACLQENEPNKFDYVLPFSGAVAMIKVYDRLLTPLEIWNASGFDSAYPVEPIRDVTVDTLTTTLRWEAGNSSIVSYYVYLGIDRLAVENAANKLRIGKTTDWSRVYKGNQSVKTTTLGPLSLNLNQTYYWRIDQLDSSGKVAQRGQVWKFSTEDGKASNPNPADGYIIVEGGVHKLQWRPGKYAVKQNLYIGTSAEEVSNKKPPDLAGLSADTNSVPLPVYNPQLGQTYYWRVDSINSGNLPVSKGQVWSLRPVSKKLKVYLLGGQSNAVGCTPLNGIQENLKGINNGVIIFIRGECRVGEYGWDYLRDGLGSPYNDNGGRGTFGPELTFGKDMRPQNPNELIAIIKCSWGGTNLGVQWRPPSAGGNVGPLYKGFVEAVHQGLAKLDKAFEPQIVGMIWMQGESDSGDQKMAEDYGKNLTSLINDIRSEFKVPDMPFVFAQISKAPAWDRPPNRGPMIREGQMQVARTVSNTATFTTDDYGLYDPWHYDTPGMVSLGERFARAMKELNKGKRNNN